MDTAAAAAAAASREAMDSFRDLEFMHFSDQIRLQTSSLSLSDTIWTTAAADDDRRNLETAASAAASVLGAPDNSWKTDLTWKPPALPFPSSSPHKLAFGHTPSSDRYNNNNQNLVTASKPTGGFFNSSSNYNGEVRDYFGNKSIGKGGAAAGGGDGRRRNYNSSGFGEGKGSVGGKKKSGNGNSNDNGGGGGAVDKRFKTLPPSEALPRSEAVGGYIFVCNNDTMQENLKRELFGLPPRYRDSVRAITPGLPLFLYNYSTHQLHGIFEAASFGGTNIDPTAWEDKKCAGESRFPAQVKVMTRKICGPLEEDSFRPILHHYDGPKFRLELSIPEALALLDIFSENNA